LKWYWWRFNGYGYFWGMVTGIGASLLLPTALPFVFDVAGFSRAHEINQDVTLIFPIVLAISLIGCVAGTLLTKPEDDEVLIDFYRRVRPWGFWGPVLAKVRAENPTFQPNKDFWRDAFNVVVGICWQIALVALPIYLVIRKLDAAAVAFAVVAVTSIILKFTWYNRLREPEPEALIAKAAARTN
jgi:solute:Na+ symporter, SSS family